MVSGVIYNKDIFEKNKLTPPTTREELEDIVASLEKKRYCAVCFSFSGIMGGSEYDHAVYDE